MCEIPSILYHGNRCFLLVTSMSHCICTQRVVSILPQTHPDFSSNSLSLHVSLHPPFLPHETICDDVRASIPPSHLIPKPSPPVAYCWWYDAHHIYPTTCVANQPQSTYQYRSSFNSSEHTHSNNNTPCAQTSLESSAARCARSFATSTGYTHHRLRRLRPRL
ncbi:hypothetical protein BDD12DRAFT_159806 [Trichophaea hybrida]|nr:hypothetical protein BDD12DRAFT_159806 [Trichophaea hybrida]